MTATRKITILSEAYFHGTMTPCCQMVRLGGLGRRLALYRAVRDSTRDVLTLDAGDWAPHPNRLSAVDHPELELETTRFMADCLKTLQLDAWTPGELELRWGRSEMRRLARRLGAPIVSANLVDGAGRRLFPDHLIFERRGIRIGVTGVTDSSLQVVVASPGVSYLDMFMSLRSVLAELRGRVDCVVVLAHVGPGKARQLAEEIPGIDMVITGHNPGYLFNPGPGGPGVHRARWQQWQVRRGDRACLRRTRAANSLPGARPGAVDPRSARTAHWRPASTRSWPNTASRPTNSRHDRPYLNRTTRCVKRRSSARTTAQ